MGAIRLAPAEELDMEWVRLLRQAQELGLGKDDIRAILNELRNAATAETAEGDPAVSRAGGFR